MSATLGVATLAYLPYCFFNLINVIVSLAYTALGFRIKHVEPKVALEAPSEEATLYGVGG